MGLDWVLNLQKIAFLVFFNNTQASKCNKWSSVWRDNSDFTTFEQHFRAILGEILPYYYQNRSGLFHFLTFSICFWLSTWINASDLFSFSRSNQQITPQFAGTVLPMNDCIEMHFSAALWCTHPHGVLVCAPKNWQNPDEPLQGEKRILFFNSQEDDLKNESWGNKKRIVLQ